MLRLFAAGFRFPKTPCLFDMHRDPAGSGIEINRLRQLYIVRIDGRIAQWCQACNAIQLSFGILAPLKSAFQF